MIFRRFFKRLKVESDSKKATQILYVFTIIYVKKKKIFWLCSFKRICWLCNDYPGLIRLFKWTGVSWLFVWTNQQLWIRYPWVGTISSIRKVCQFGIKSIYIYEYFFEPKNGTDINKYLLWLLQRNKMKISYFFVCVKPNSSGGKFFKNPISLFDNTGKCPLSIKERCKFCFVCEKCRLVTFSDFNYRSSPPEVSLKKGVLKIYSKFTGKQPC